MSLNSVVSGLVRAASGIPEDISDADLDRHVARLLAEEAKVKESKWNELGLSGLLGNSMLAGRDSPDTSLPKTNKRFLASIIRATDGHNSALLKQQAEAARQARGERIPETSAKGASSVNAKSRRAPGGAVNRLFGGALKDMSKNQSSKPIREHGTVGREVGKDGRSERSKGKDRERTPDIDERERHVLRDQRRHREEEPARRHEDRDEWHRDRSHRAHERHDREYERDEEMSSRNGHSRDHKRYDSEEDRSRSKSHRYRDSASERDSHRRSKSKKYETEARPRSQSPPKRRRRSVSPTKHSPIPPPPSDPSPPPRPPSHSPSYSPPPPPNSKMDKYFDKSYDPRLDLPDVPSEGLIQEVGWDNMLAILKERGQKKRRNSPGLSEDEVAPPLGILPKKRAYSPDATRRKLDRYERKTAREERKKRRGDSDSEDDRDRRRRKEKRRKEKEREKEKEKESWKDGESGLLKGYEYAKKGATREWDQGK